MIPVTIKLDSEQNQRCIIDKINYFGCDKNLQVTISLCDENKTEDDSGDDLAA